MQVVPECGLMVLRWFLYRQSLSSAKEIGCGLDCDVCVICEKATWVYAAMVECGGYC